MKKIFATVLILSLAITVFAGCGASSPGAPIEEAPVPAPAPEAPAAAPVEEAPASSFDGSREIVVVSREDGSGTRGAFIELFGVQERGDDGSTRDLTTREAIIADKTDIVMTNIAGDPYAIGYLSMGSLNETIKAVPINGAAATAENIKNGSYEIQRPFNIAIKGEASGLQKDFIDFILSKEGQEVAVDRGYIAAIDNAPAYSGNKPQGKIVVSGSSSVYPLMERLAEEYAKINTEATIEVHLSDSSAGMTAAIDGTADIGMASRALRESELEELTDIVIALDGIAVIVNRENPIASISPEQVRGIFVGEITNWSDVQ